MSLFFQNEATKKNGTLVKPVLVDNFTEKPKQNSNSSRKTVISNENSLVTAVTQPLEGIVFRNVIIGEHISRELLIPNIYLLFCSYYFHILSQQADPIERK